MSQTAELSSPVAAAPPETDGRIGRRISDWTGALVLLVATAFYLGTAIRADLPVGSALAALAGLVLTQLLPGALIWRTIRPVKGWWIEDVMIGLAIGFMLAIGSQIVAGWTQQPWIDLAVPIVIVVALLGIRRTRNRISRVRTSRLPSWWMPLVCLIPLFNLKDLLGYYNYVPLTWASGYRSPHVDAYLHLAMAAELQHRGPVSFPWVQGTEMAYHWFGHAHVAQLATVSGAGLDEVIFRFLPALMPLTIVLVVAAAAVRLTGRAWAGPVAALLTMAGSELNLLGMYTPAFPVSPISPSLAPSIPLMIAIVVLLWLHARGEMSRVGLVMIPLLGIAAAGTKGSTIPLLVAGLGLAFVAMILVDRSRLRTLLVDGVLCVGTLVVAYVFVFRGSSSGLHVQFHDAAMQTPSITRLGAVTTTTMTISSLLAVLAIMARGTGLLWRLKTAAGRRDPITWVLLGGGLAGAFAVAVFTHPGLSQWYFARTGGPLLALGSALGLVVMVDDLGKRGRWAIALGVVLGPAMILLPVALVGEIRPNHGDLIHASKLIGLSLLILLVIGAVAAAITPRLRGAAIAAAVTCAILAGGVTIAVKGQFTTGVRPPLQPVAANQVQAVGRGQIEAARWIRDHSDINDLVMTNRHCTTPIEPKRCDSRRFVVGAFSERQMLVEAWTPTVEANDAGPNGRDSVFVDYWKPDILALNDGFVAHPDSEKAHRLQELGVRWIMVDFTRPHATTLEPLAKERMRNQEAAVYEMPPAGS
ncbi:4-amino-4-deoxy-L-arabinose transferase-like glycosyltransferase [Kribbella sp. VKM Ac-2527]|uniref:4-amino-4-deoxy-L-arabinose transferase-like glycosyltransferase n=1 Tax=Kribbella caucasensis TaxID=2512215 RepID=A0A4R6KIF2_9ACTN|nr:hypothetical protein [Kribbella sp. VKM Ac-2527]TDO50870.1 4-amino-4-deoxy-L-arabinose transferase-like glycosyltransferase [Kribbella sp. VKM Ac-2527]